MAKLYWNTDRTKNINSKNIVELYTTFIKTTVGLNYSELSEYCDTIYARDPGTNYFSQLTTPINFLGLLEYKEEGNDFKVVENIFIKNNIENETFSKLYADYYLSYWQYPRHNMTEDRALTKRKPYLLVLKLLKLLFDIDPEQAYLTKEELFYLFENDINHRKSYDDINIALANNILDNNREWGKSKTIIDNGIVSYDKTMFKNSSILTFETNDYNSPSNFIFGLSKKVNAIKKLNWITSDVVKDDFFDFDPNISSANKDVITKWGQFINNKDRFSKWFTAMTLYDFEEYCLLEGFKFDTDLLRRFILSLETKPFLILTGISGSGKTKIAELYSEYLEKNARGLQLMKAIGSNWNDNKKLLGFKNPLVEDNDTAYQETDLVKFIKMANANLDKTFIVILDEMNLSYTEKYFADFLSALETRKHEIKLSNEEIIVWSENLKIIGTINEDETTHTISPKVLDRANVIEMNGLRPSEYIDSQLQKDDDNLYKSFSFDIEEYKSLLDDIYDCLNGNFAFRVINEITKYIENNRIHAEEKLLHELLDEQIYQKILPKVHGSKMDLPKKLGVLKQILEDTSNPYSFTIQKIDRMLSHVATHGYASFVNG